jgi:hypothetical protein
VSDAPRAKQGVSRDCIYRLLPDDEGGGAIKDYENLILKVMNVSRNYQSSRRKNFEDRETAMGTF